MKYVEDNIVDVENDSQDQLRTNDLTNTTDMSISTQGSSSPISIGSRSSPSGSTNSSPGSNADPITSPENNEEQPKKKARTNYTNEQVQTLLKIFHENPYPDSEHMETIGKDLGIPENKIKVKINTVVCFSEVSFRNLTRTTNVICLCLCYWY